MKMYAYEINNKLIICDFLALLSILLEQEIPEELRGGRSQMGSAGQVPKRWEQAGPHLAKRAQGVSHHSPEGHQAFSVCSPQDPYRCLHALNICYKYKIDKRRILALSIIQCVHMSKYP